MRKQEIYCNNCDGEFTIESPLLTVSFYQIVDLRSNLKQTMMIGKTMSGINWNQFFHAWSNVDGCNWVINTYDNKLEYMENKTVQEWIKASKECLKEKHGIPVQLQS